MTDITATKNEDAYGVVLTARRAKTPMLTRISLTWPEANKLQAELRQLCIDAGITLRGL
jgi:hypothetical protein